MGVSNYHLITFGCSHTFGHGLPDCWFDGNKVGRTPSQLAWPNLLQKKLSMRSIDNKSWPGNSNKQILKSIIDYSNYNKNSLVIILWSNFNRKTIYKNQKECFAMMPHHTTLSKKDLPSKIWNDPDRKNIVRKIRSYYGEYHEEFDAIFDTLVYVNYAHAFLKSKSIRSYHLIAEHELDFEREYFKKFNITGINLKEFVWQTDYKIDDALDTPVAHPGVKSHRLFAENIEKWFFK